jgi:hypothetical protein
LKSSGEAYHAHFAGTLMELGFRASKTDPDVWMHPAKKERDYYEYLLTYVDDCLVVPHDLKKSIDSLEQE